MKVVQTSIPTKDSMFHGHLKKFMYKYVCITILITNPLSPLPEPTQNRQEGGKGSKEGSLSLKGVLRGVRKDTLGLSRPGTGPILQRIGCRVLGEVRVRLSLTFKTVRSWTTTRTSF